MPCCDPIGGLNQPGGVEPQSRSDPDPPGGGQACPVGAGRADGLGSISAVGWLVGELMLVGAVGVHDPDSVVPVVVGDLGSVG